MPKSILVIGSSNTDMVIKTSKFPAPGETLLGGEFFLFPGGKGANQAVAAARLGAKVTFIAKVGDDVFGTKVLQQLKDEGINTSHIHIDKHNPSGVALITVDSNGENTIVVAQGANGALSPEDVLAAETEFGSCDVVLLQLEIPIMTVMKAVELAAKYSRKVILNPAPAPTTSLPSEIFTLLYLITPNESEASAIVGEDVSSESSVRKAAKSMHEKGVPNVVITLGAKGAFISNHQIDRLIESPHVVPVDTTAAGDIFNGALAVALAEGKNLDEGVTFANHAAAISVTKMGAQSSAPLRDELLKKFNL
jgi:ribokinase